MIRNALAEICCTVRFNVEYHRKDKGIALMHWLRFGYPLGKPAQALTVSSNGSGAAG